MSNSWVSGSHVICWVLCRGPHEILDLEITTSPGHDISIVARGEVDLQIKKYAISTSAGTDLQKSSNLVRSGINLQIKKKKLCTFQVCLYRVALCSGSQTFVQRCNVTLLPKFIKNFRIISRAVSWTPLI